MLASLVVVPVAPIVGAVLGSIAGRQISEDATLSGKGRAAYAARFGAVAGCIQVLALAGYVYSAWASIENAASVVGSEVLLAGKGDAVSVEPAFGLHEFVPGSTRRYEVSTGEKSATVRVRFDSMPTWTGSGFVFGATVVGRPGGLADHGE